MASSENYVGISQFATDVWVWLVYGVLCQLLNMFGVATNIINIICFAKQGFKDSVNISLTGLAVSDLGSLVTMVWTCVCLTPAVVTANMSFDPVECMYLTSGLTHLSFTRVSSCITALITLERCLCIAAPLKIKSIFTSRRMTVIVVLISVTFFCSAVPMWVAYRLDWKFSSFRNKTVVGMVPGQKLENVEMISYTINNCVIPVSSFIIIAVCTIVLSVQLKRISTWRRATISNTQVDKVSIRNQKVTKMVVMISTMFIVCFLPVTVVSFLFAFLPELSVNGKYINISLIVAGFGYVMESFNSSFNIFIYYHMSTKYRTYFMNVFLKLKFSVHETQD